MEHLEKLLVRENIGLVLRLFAGKPEAVKQQCDRNLALARKAAEMRVDGKPVFKTVLIMIASDTRRVDHDCGESYGYILSALRSEPNQRIIVISSERDDLFCGILNAASAELLRRGCRFMAVFSHAAHEYLDEKFMESAAKAFSLGAVAAGLAITELQQSILRGLLANTAMIWDVQELVSVGGFDQYAEQPFKKDEQGLFTDERLVNWVQGKRSDGKDGLYPNAGVEEIIPLVRLCRKLDRACIAPIMPSSGKIWENPTDHDELRRHLNKLGSKELRQRHMAAHANADIEMLADAVMVGYGLQD